MEQQPLIFDFLLFFFFFFINDVFEGSFSVNLKRASSKDIKKNKLYMLRHLVSWQRCGCIDWNVHIPQAPTIVISTNALNESHVVSELIG